jgi:hypothetical protein
MTILHEIQNLAKQIYVKEVKKWFFFWGGGGLEFVCSVCCALHSRHFATCATSPVHFALVILEMGVSWAVCPGWHQTVILSISRLPSIQDYRQEPPIPSSEKWLSWGVGCWLWNSYEEDLYNGGNGLYFYFGSAFSGVYICKNLGLQEK